jgi:hypothetical protein
MEHQPKTYSTTIASWSRIAEGAIQSVLRVNGFAVV